MGQSLGSWVESWLSEHLGNSRLFWNTPSMVDL
jgi:hypothetical protein